MILTTCKPGYYQCPETGRCVSDEDQEILQSKFSSNNTGTVTSNDPIQRRYKIRRPETINGYAPLDSGYEDHMKSIIKNGGNPEYETTLPTNGYQSHEILNRRFTNNYRDSI